MSLLTNLLVALLAAGPSRPAISADGVRADRSSLQDVSDRSQADVLPGEWLIDRPALEVFAAARETLRAHGFRFDRDDAAAGLLVTRRVAYDARWPDAAALGLRVIHTPAAVTLYVQVAPGFEPARFAVGAVLETTTAFVPYSARKVLGTSTMFGYAPLAAFFAAGIADRLGVALEPIAADAAERARRDRPLDGGRATRCGPAPLTVSRAGGAVPTLKHQVKPSYPSTEFIRRVGGAVRLRGEVTEHGTVTGLSWAGGVEDANLVAAATGAAGLWRFAAAVVDGCAVRRSITIEMSFSIGR